MVNRERLIELLLQLVHIDSPSKNERGIADFINKYLTDLGLEVYEDDAGAKIHGNAGNVIAVLPATVSNGNSQGEKIVVAAHMDTVRSSAGVKPVLDGGIIRTDGTSILGADDKAGVAAILEAAKLVKEKNTAHGEIILVFTVAEEIGLFGAQHLDAKIFAGRDTDSLDRGSVVENSLAGEESLDKDKVLGYVLDSGGPVGTVIVQAPAEEDFNLEITGRSAHAGVNPEDGINAIMVAAKLLARLPGGRLDEETTANIGVIRGGEATNIVPDRVLLEGEVRSRNPEKINGYLDGLVKDLMETASQAGARYKLETRRMYEAFSIEPNAPVVKRVEAAASRIGVNLDLKPRGGGSDANIFNAIGIPTVNLGIGLNKDHTFEENIATENLVKSAELLLELFLAKGS